MVVHNVLGAEAPLQDPGAGFQLAHLPAAPPGRELTTDESSADYQPVFGVIEPPAQLLGGAQRAQGADPANGKPGTSSVRSRTQVASTSCSYRWTGSHALGFVELYFHESSSSFYQVTGSRYAP
ncbi:hypothetical protein ACQPZQ_31905 [Pseudonocardia sp. CA-142604]|uniref:hypothetical protein n=1 Tax=Pseudonocardia sp. CA-142604 TaxID=3240024 RepID=UPI003D89CA04